MAYNATYVSDDTSAVTIDLLVTVVVALVSFGTLIGLIIMYNWAKNKLPKF